jgi:steroid delta-isomerase-like uncharacterized protein
MTPAGEIAYLEAGAGPPALFIHGLFLNGDLWHHQLEALADVRRCLAVDLLAHGASAVPADGQLSISLQADMVAGFLDSLGIDAVDIVGNDSGGAVAQLLAARIPHRVRTLTLTNCDAHDNWPPAAFAPIRDLAVRGVLAESLMALGTDPQAARIALAASLEHPDEIPEQTIRSFFGPFAATAARATAIENYVAGMDCSVTVAIRDQLARFVAPTLIVWGADDAFFNASWARWLADTIPGTVSCVEIPGARLFHPLERPEILNGELRALWNVSDAHSTLNRYLDAWNRHDLGAVIALHTDDTVYTMHAGGISHSGRDAVLDAFRADLGAWPDAHWHPSRRTVTGTVCVLESTMTATAAGPLHALGFSLTPGAAVRARCVDVLTLSRGRIARKDTYLDVVELLATAQPATQ